MADISKIRLNDTIYDIKDEELRHMIDVLLGKSEVDSNNEKDLSKENEQQ